MVAQKQAPVDDRAASRDANQFVGFGKHMWLTFKEIAERQPGYCYWVLEYSKPSDQMRRLQVYLRGHPHFSPEAIASATGLTSGIDTSVPIWIQRFLEQGRTQNNVATAGKLGSLEGLRRDKVGLLHTYQMEGIAFGIGRAGRVLLGDEMGLGKTVQALAIAVHFQKDWPLLIIVPAPLRSVWFAEVHKWLSDAHVQVVTAGGEKLNPSCNVYIVSYELVVSKEHFRSAPQGGDFQIVICDEAHYLRHDMSQRTQVIVPVLQRARRAVLLSGTPLLNGAFDVYPQLDALVPGIIPNPGAFAERYCNIVESPFSYGKKYQGVLRSEELSQVLSAVMIQRRKADVAEALPPKRWRMVPVTTAQGSTPCHAVPWDIEPEKAQAQGMASWAQAWADAGKAKIEPACDYLALLLEGLVSGEKVLVFAHHQKVLDGLESGLQSQYGDKKAFIRIDGKTSRTQRDSDIQRFQDNSEIRIALLSITSCSLGITLTAASHVVFVELFAVPGVMRQAEDRAHRVGQQRCVDIHYLIMHGTIDERLMESLVRKRVELAEVFVPQADHSKQCKAFINEGTDVNIEASPRGWRSSGDTVEVFGDDDAHANTEKITCSSDLERSDHALAQLVSMGFDAGDAHAAVQKAKANLEIALGMLTAVEDTKKTHPPIVDILDNDIAELVGMGFDSASASSALGRAGGKFEGALEMLLSST